MQGPGPGARASERGDVCSCRALADHSLQFAEDDMSVAIGVHQLKELLRVRHPLGCELGHPACKEVCELAHL